MVPVTEEAHWATNQKLSPFTSAMSSVGVKTFPMMRTYPLWYPYIQNDEYLFGAAARN